MRRRVEASSTLKEQLSRRVRAYVGLEKWGIASEPQLSIVGLDLRLLSRGCLPYSAVGN